MKYITLHLSSPRESRFTKDLVIAFPNDLVHKIVAEALKAAAQVQWPDYKVEVIAAGDIEVAAQYTGGKSESLKLKGRQIDAMSFNFADYGNNINVPRNSK